MGTVGIVSSGYREFRTPGGLAHVVACVWEHRPAADRLQRIVPDGCVDLIWMADQALVIAGPDTGPRIVELPAGVLSSGIRIRPGAAGAVLGCPTSEIRDHQVDAELVWGRQSAQLREELALTAPEQRLDLLADAIARRHSEPDVLVVEAARRLAVPGARVTAVAAGLGVSERQLNRRTLTAVGYGPKVLSRVARLRRLVALCGQNSLGARAVDAGFASQAHMNEEVLRLTGLTPVRFLKDAILTAA